MNRWEVNHPEELERVISILEWIQRDFNDEQERSGSGGRVSLADLLVLGGCAAVEEAVRKAGFDIRMASMPGRVDAQQEQVEVEFYQELEPIADGFRNYFRDAGRIDEGDIHTTPEYLLVDKAQLLRLTVPRWSFWWAG